MKGYIYKYTFSDGKFYIGQTRRNPEIRHREHLNPIIGPANTGFWDAYQCLGEPTYEIIETIENENVTDLVDLLNKRETYWIKYYEADKFFYQCGLTHTPSAVYDNKSTVTLVFSFQCFQFRLTSNKSHEAPRLNINLFMIILIIL